MLKTLTIALVLLFISLPTSAQKDQPEPDYALAFSSFAPLNTEVFIADADGRNARVLASNAGLDYDASFSPDGKWVIFTSTRNGSADLYRMHTDGTQLERLTDDPAFDDQAAISRDGTFVAFVSSRSGNADIWVMDLATRTPLRNLTKNSPAGDFRPSWSPDGKWIAFSSDRDSAKPKGNGGFEIAHSTEIYVVHPNGSGLRRVTNAREFAGSPTWSPDGKRLVFYQTTIAELNKTAGARRIPGLGQIAEIDLDSNETKIITSGENEKWSPRFVAAERIGYVSHGPDGGVEFSDGAKGSRGEFNSPDWSPDGRRMLFHRDVGNGWPPFQKWRSRDDHFKLVRTGVFPSFSPSGDNFVSNDETAGILHNSIIRMNADGSNSTVLFTDAVKSSLAPVWSPKGGKIAFAIGRFFQTIGGSAIADIATINADGSGLKILTKRDGNFGFPSWSPDEKHLVFRGASKEKGGLFIVDIETGDIRVLTSENHDNFPAWSPNGDVISFTGYRGGDFEIYTIRPDGTDLKRLTTSPGNDAHNSWSPDGKWIAFATGRGGFKDESALHPYNPQPYGEICVVRSDGSDVRVLTDNQFEEATPSWIPKPRSK
ncbi:MAG: hypothetical protein ABI999_02570 [Acidobacteriota bacterium]